MEDLDLANMIETKEYQLTEKQYFNIIFFYKFKLNILSSILKILFILFLAYQYFLTNDIVFLFLALAPFIIEVYYGINLYFNFVKNEENKNIYLKRKIIFNYEHLGIVLDNTDKIREIDFEYLVKIANRSKYWLLYINKSNFHYIPKNIFNSIENFLAFEDLINEKTLGIKKIK